jgi:hypothetical protein
MSCFDVPVLPRSSVKILLMCSFFLVSGLGHPETTVRTAKIVRNDAAAQGDARPDGGTSILRKHAREPASAVSEADLAMMSAQALATTLVDHDADRLQGTFAATPEPPAGVMGGIALAALALLRVGRRWFIRA